MDIKKRFELSCKIVNNLKKKPTTNELLRLYGLYKQSTCGSCNVKEPNKLFINDCLKWNAWKQNYGKHKSDTMNEYSNYVMDLIDKYGLNK